MKLRFAIVAVALATPVSVAHGQTADEWMKRATTKYHAKDYEGAIADLNKYIKLRPRSYAAYRFRAVMKRALEDYKEAIVDFTKVIALKPKLWVNYHERGELRVTVNDLDGAIADFTKAVQVQPLERSWPSLHSRAVVMYRKGRYADAIQDHSKVLRLVPKNHKAYASRGLCRRALHDYKGALADLTKAIQIRGTWPAGVDAYYHYSAQTRAMAGDKSGAIADSTKAAKLNPKKADYPIWIAGFGGGTSLLKPIARETEWIANVARYYLGTTTEAVLLAKAKEFPPWEDKGTANRQLCKAHGYIGLKAERDSNRAKAVKHYQACLKTKLSELLEYQWARDRLRKWGKLGGPCTKCKKAVTPNAKSCANCGTKIAQRGCKSCKKWLPKGSRFCPNCKAKQ